MANKAHIWSKNDKITAARLNTMSKAINSLAEGSGTDNDKPHGDSDTANWQTAIDDAQPVQHDKANWLGYRHPVYGTADLYDDNLPIGMYATAPAIINADGSIARNISHFGCMPCHISSGECTQTVYLQYLTDKYGNLISGTHNATYYLGDNSSAEPQWFGLNAAGTGGVMYQPIARIGKDPKFECQMQAMHFNPVQIPLKTDNAAYLPPYTSGSRGLQGMIIADPPEGNIVPVRGINNHGGVKILPAYDTDGTRRSNAIMASPEIYGRATAAEYDAAVSDGTCDIYGAYYPAGSQAWYFRQTYNSMYPFASGDGGTLAKWPIYQPPVDMVCGELVVGSPVKIGELSLIGGHVGCNDWQMWFQGQGQIVLPPAMVGAQSPYAPGPVGSW